MFASDKESPGLPSDMGNGVELPCPSKATCGFFPGGFSALEPAIFLSLR